jgi:hypothetical protein
MSSNPRIPRIKDLDVPFFAARLADRMRARADKEERIRERPNERPQLAMALLYSDCAHMGFYEFALGYPIEQIRRSFAEAAGAALKVFELRGTEQCEVNGVWIKEYSTTNSQNCFEAICVSLVAGEWIIARSLAELMWDPANADYIGPKSEVCTTSQQSVACATRYLLLEQPAEIEKELRRIGPGRREQQIAALAKMVRGMAQHSDAIFNEGLLELLFFHGRFARRRDHETDPHRFFSLAAAGLSSLAIRRGLITKPQLPGDEYLAMDLIPDGDCLRKS